MKKLPIAVNTYSYIYSLSAFDSVRHLLGLGFKRFELLFNAGHIWVSDLEPSVRRSPPTWLANDGAEIVSFNLPIMDHNLTICTVYMPRDVFHIKLHRSLITRLNQPYDLRWILVDNSQGSSESIIDSDDPQTIVKLQYFY